MNSTQLHPCGTAGIIARARTLPAARQRPHTHVRYPVGASRAPPRAPGTTPRAAAAQGALKAAPGSPVAGHRRVLHVDGDAGAARILAILLSPEALVTAAGTLAEARRLLSTEVFSLVVLDPALPDGDGRALLPLLDGTPLLIYAAAEPEARGGAPAYLPKPWTSARQLWIAIAGLLGVPASLNAGD